LNYKFFFLFSLSFFFLFLPTVEAIAVFPSYTEFNYNPGEKTKLSFNVMGAGEYGVEVKVEGDFKENVIVDDSYLKCKEYKCSVSVEVEIPNLDENPGKHTSMIHFATGLPPLEYGQKDGLSARVAVAVPMIIYGPYPDKFLVAKATTQSGKSSFNVGDKVYFQVEVTSHGKKIINNLDGVMHIYSQVDSYNVTVPLTELRDFGYKDRDFMLAEWDTTGIEYGNYYYHALINYDEKKTKSNGRILEVGDKLVIVDLLTNVLEIGSVREISLLLKNLWSEKMKASTMISILDSEGNVLTEVETKTIELNGRSQSKIDSFIDISNLELGDYDLKTITTFAEGLTHEQDFKITISPEKKEEKSMEPDEETPFFNGFTTTIVVFTLLIIILIILHLKNKNKEEEDI